MKKLQCNFTTPKQSKRLLDLGVPKWTADCVYDSQGRLHIAPNEYIFEDCPTLLPCWSVGRLIEIYTICYDPDYIEFDTFADGTSFLKQIMDKFETYTENMDFSKLEE